LRTRDIVSGLNDLTLDLGLVRETGISSRHKRTQLTKLDYCIFVPKKLPSAKPDVDSRWILENVPLAVQASTGSFEKALEEAVEQLAEHPARM